MPKMTGGEAMLLAAKENGIRQLFGIPGVQTYPLWDALQRHRGEVQTILTKHEQGAAYMAFGAAKSTGRPAACSVVPGPGVLNASAALCTAMGTCSQVLCMTGQVPSSFMGVGRGHLHELGDQAGTLRSIIKDAIHIEDPAQTSAAVNKAFRIMAGGRPGPVAIDMSWDGMAGTHDLAIGEGNRRVDKPALDEDRLKAAAQAVAAARRPMIMCGAGAQDAADEVLALAELLNCPVTALRSGRGLVAEDHPLGVASVAARLLWDDCDLLLGIGSRLEMQYMRWTGMLTYRRRPEDGRVLVRIDIDPQEMERFVPHHPLVADAADACAALVSELAPMVPDRRGRREEIAAAKAKAERLIQRIQPQVAYWKVIRELLPRDGFIVPEVCQMGFTSYFGVPVLAPRTYVTEGFQGNLGFGFQTALGVKAANPQRAVVSVTGDGGFMFGVQELATAARYRIGLITLVFNNGVFGNVLRDQNIHYAGRHIGVHLHNPDLAKLAEVFGVKGVKVAGPEELRPVLARAIDDDEPILIEVSVETGSETSPWEFILMEQAPA